MTRAELQQNKPLLRELAKTSDKIKVHKVNIGEDLTL